jgi:anaerobic selenocysteine-containing dehydrogenase
VLLPSQQEFKKYEKVGFATPPGKIELYSTVFEKLRYDPLPYYEEPPESPVRMPELLDEYPLILNPGGEVYALVPFGTPAIGHRAPRDAPRSPRNHTS